MASKGKKIAILHSSVLSLEGPRTNLHTVLLREPGGNMAGWGSGWLAQCFLWLVRKFSESKSKYGMSPPHSQVRSLELNPVIIHGHRSNSVFLTGYSASWREKCLFPSDFSKYWTSDCFSAWKSFQPDLVGWCPPPSKWSHVGGRVATHRCPWGFPPKPSPNAS